MKFPIKKSYFLYAAITVVVIAAIVLAIVFSINKNDVEKDNRSFGAVVSNGRDCADIGAQILSIGGSAVDGAVATLVCEGAMVPQSMGIGGGFVGIFYNKNSKKMETLIARESAPGDAHRDMFINKTITGAISAGVPGELLGYWQMHQKYGKLPWKTLFEPTIKICREGIVVSLHMLNAIKQKESILRTQPYLSKIFFKDDGTLYEEGEKFTRIDLARTLEKISNSGPDIFYNGEMGKMFVEDLAAQGGIITVDDLKSYKTSWEDNALTTTNITGGYTLFTTPLPSSGPVLAFMFRILNTLYTEQVGVFWHRVIETFKHAYGQRTHLGDTNFEPTMANEIKATLDRLDNSDFVTEIRSKIQDSRTFTNFDYYGADFSNVADHGTSNIAVLGTDGSAVVITSTINSYFGALVISNRTGIIPNNEMDDFSTPGVINSYGLRASPANYIQPYKRPLSSMCPSIILDGNGDVKLLVGAAGGSKITSAIASVIMQYLLYNKSMNEAVEASRLHHQLAPMVVNIEQNVPIEITSYLEKVGHILELEKSPTGFAAITAIGALQEIPVPVFDKRRVGSKATVQAPNKL